MRIVIQRVREASVTIGGVLKSAVGAGMMILVGVEHDDTDDDVEWLVKKTLGLRIFDDDAGVMNRSVLDVGGEILVVSQFTLHASTRKGNRPSYIRAARPETAVPLYRDFIDLSQRGFAEALRRRGVWCRHAGGACQRRSCDYNH